MAMSREKVVKKSIPECAFERDPKVYSPVAVTASCGGVVLEEVISKDDGFVTITGEKDMMQRRTVVVELIDPDKGLPVEESLVLRTKGLVTEDNDEVTIREVLMKFPVAKQLAKHNEKRATIVNEEILNRTGSEVFLRPVKLKDLQWVVK